jgi:hypothetical protein
MNDIKGLISSISKMIKLLKKNYDHNAEGQKNLYNGHQELYSRSMKNGYVALVS